MAQHQEGTPLSPLLEESRERRQDSGPVVCVCCVCLLFVFILFVYYCVTFVPESYSVCVVHYCSPNPRVHVPETGRCSHPGPVRTPALRPMEEQQSGRVGTGFLLRPNGPAWTETKKGFAASKRKKAVTGWSPARDLAATKLTGTPRDAAVFKRPSVREVAMLLDSLPSPGLPPVVRTAALSVNTISTLQDYQQNGPRWASAADAHRAEYESVQQREAAARESHFVLLDGLPLAVAADTAHGILCPWKPESSSLLLGKTGDVKDQAAPAMRQEEDAKSEGGTGVARCANNRRRHKGTTLMDTISSKHKPSGALTDRSAASQCRQSAEVHESGFGVQSPKLMSHKMFKAPLRSRPVR